MVLGYFVLWVSSWPATIRIGKFGEDLWKDSSLGNYFSIAYIDWRKGFDFERKCIADFSIIFTLQCHFDWFFVWFKIVFLWVLCVVPSTNDQKWSISFRPKTVVAEDSQRSYHIDWCNETSMDQIIYIVVESIRICSIRYNFRFIVWLWNYSHKLN